MKGLAKEPINLSDRILGHFSSNRTIWESSTDNKMLQGFGIQLSHGLIQRCDLPWLRTFDILRYRAIHGKTKDRNSKLLAVMQALEGKMQQVTENTDCKLNLKELGFRNRKAVVHKDQWRDEIWLDWWRRLQQEKKWRENASKRRSKMNQGRNLAWLMATVAATQELDRKCIRTEIEDKLRNSFPSPWTEVWRGNEEEERKLKTMTQLFFSIRISVFIVKVYGIFLIINIVIIKTIHANIIISKLIIKIVLFCISLSIIYFSPPLFKRTEYL